MNFLYRYQSFRFLIPTGRAGRSSARTAPPLTQNPQSLECATRIADLAVIDIENVVGHCITVKALLRRFNSTMWQSPPSALP